MKRKNMIVMGLLCMMSIPAFSQKVTTSANDSTINAIKIKELTLRRDNLKKQITVEDAKRNRQVVGVSIESLEVMNDRQDSICLDLRSQLVTVELELKGLIPDKLVATVANQLNQLNQNQPQTTQGNAASQQPAKVNNGRKK